MQTGKTCPSFDLREFNDRRRRGVGSLIVSLTLLILFLHLDTDHSVDFAIVAVQQLVLNGESWVL